jgi:pilus assembly protein Flp/PilA
MKAKLTEKLLEIYVTIKCLTMREEGQDLIEYALIIALIAFAATVGMSSLASGINSAFGSISDKLTSAI